MKNAVFILFSLILVTSLFGTVWKVDNNSQVDADFTNLQDAHDGAVNGDVLLVTGSESSYGSLVLTKKLIVIGTGYFLDENPETQANKHVAAASSVIFNSASVGSVITGISMYYIDINADSITVKRCKIYSVSTSTDAINISSNHDVYIYQNYIYASGSSSSGVEILNGAYNILIENNIIRHGSYSQYSVYMYPNSSAIIKNNVLYGYISTRGAEFYNNILKYGNFYDNGSTNYYNNIGNSDQFVPCGENGNQCNISMNSVFVSSGSTDGIYQLSIGSPAIDAGAIGEDCGAFDGDYPYVLSGIPSEVPAIYEFSAPAAGFEIPVHIKAKSHE